jgi:hypothetical protein
MKTLFLFLFVFSSIGFSQELNCKVTLNTESIPIASRDKLRGFAQAVDDYMNKTHFTDSWEGGKIDCSLTIVVLTASGEVNYSAQVIVTSLRPIYKSQDNSLVLSINDNTWSFSYDQGQSLYQNSTVFDPLTSFLDYYAYIIIGFDMDTWDKLGGTPYFSKAYDIVNLASTSGFSSGWTKNSSAYNRRGLVDDLLSEKFRSFRESIYDYYYGIDIYGMNPKAGQEKIVKLVTTLNNMRQKFDLNSVLTKVFFDAKAGEIVEKLKTYPGKQEVFAELKRIDPSHAAKYDTQLAN